MFDVYRSSYRVWRDRSTGSRPEELRLQVLIKTTLKASNGLAGACSIARIVTQGETPLSRYCASRRIQLGVSATAMALPHDSEPEPPWQLPG
ncbi:hypothetical protein ACCI49_22050 [Microbulbifer epialgicus]|uniref:Uncharacterized protein n=1 Tax=Microbulbifer epialgicus TaxID=393907 RepID=A0ABV4P5C4_9GAMM